MRPHSPARRRGMSSGSRRRGIILPARLSCSGRDLGSSLLLPRPRTQASRFTSHVVRRRSLAGDRLTARPRPAPPRNLPQLLLPEGIRGLRHARYSARRKIPGRKLLTAHVLQHARDKHYGGVVGDAGMGPAVMSATWTTLQSGGWTNTSERIIEV